MSLYTANPDGTRPAAVLRRQQPQHRHQQHRRGVRAPQADAGRPHPHLARQYTDVDDGGDLIIIDGAKYVENTQALLSSAGSTGPAQTRGDHAGRHHDPRPLTGRPLHLRLSAVGWHQPHPGELDAVPPAGHDADAAAHRAVQLDHAERRQPDGRAAAVQRVDVRPEPGHPAADHDPGRGRDDHGRGGRAALHAAEHHPRQGAGRGPRPEPGRRRRRRHRHPQRLRHRRRGYRHAEHRNGGRLVQDGARRASGALPAPGEGGVDPRQDDRGPRRMPPSAPPTTCARSSATRPSSRTARCACEVPANVAFRMAVLDANGRRISSEQRAWLSGAPRGDPYLQRLPPARDRAEAGVARPPGTVQLRLGRSGRQRHRVPRHDCLRSRRYHSRPGRNHGPGAHARELPERHSGVQADGAGRQRGLHRRVDRPGAGDPGGADQPAL